ncbi:uncharacterized protein N7459_008201 [Penicillium hispanicum]|uniref:uncharacterized protein n=1 Tax=Penicillium hispanicum TaxID=1080232 RepID=UPI00253FB292|nr:uncharacterized protein N7459_008201 [Penicillium hispanicum]KAJ5573774.1 hypothetical protein N7459_008201 [Penicillium hispanicum]
MATATKIQLSPSTDSGVYSSGVREDAARVASEVLQDDMAAHHVFFNERGFHNHIVHQILTIYALGASPDDIRSAYDRSKSYQRPVFLVDTNLVTALHEKTTFQASLGKEKNYATFLTFFQEEIESKGVGDVLNEYVFSGDERAESMLLRLFGGLLHPLIHLGFGIEFNQPAIVAQALAQTAVHKEGFGRKYFLPAEQMAGGIGQPGSKSLLQLLNEIRANTALKESVKYSDPSNIADGVLTRAPQEMLKYASQFTVSTDQVEERLADMINTVVYYTTAAQRPNKEVKLDFFYLHAVNSSIFLSKIMNLPSLDQRTKLRLLEWKGRINLLLYVAYGSPDLLVDEVARYPARQDWATIFSRSVKHHRDDGHLAKFARAVAHAQKVCEQAESRGVQAMPISGDMWLRIGNMALDSTVGETMWIRSAGFDEAWENLATRERQRL